MPPAHETLDETKAFLERYPPFLALGADALDALASTAEIEYFEAGTEVLRQEGAPSAHLYVVRRGAIDLVDEGVVVDVLEEGESFGHPSLLSGLPAAFTARAREDTLCYLFTADAAVAALSQPAGVQFVVSSLERRFDHAAAHAKGVKPWITAHAGALARPALSLAPETSIRDVATRMTAAGERAAVISLAGAYGLVTDRELREKVVAGGVSVDAPVSTIARTPAPSVREDRLALDALVDLLVAATEHALVLDRDGSLVGVIDRAALLDLDSPSSLVVRQEIERATDVDALARAVAGLPAVAVHLLDAHVEPLDVLALLSSAADALTRRLGELTIAELGEPPAPWAWLALGSEARSEQTLSTDQDNALAFDGEGAETESYFAVFAERMNERLARCGYAECRANVMARNPGWRLSRTGWLELFESLLRAPTRDLVRVAMIGLDVRAVTGPLAIQSDLDALLATAPEHPYLLERLAHAAQELRPPLGFLRDLVVERTGEHVGTLDVKSGGIVPLVDLARFHALSAGSTAKPTLERLRTAAARGALPEESAAELAEAFTTLCRVRLEHQAAQVEGGARPDNHVDPRRLSPPDRRRLKEAFRAIARAQTALETRPATRIP